MNKAVILGVDHLLYRDQRFGFTAIRSPAIHQSLIGTQGRHGGSPTSCQTLESELGILLCISGDGANVLARFEKQPPIIDGTPAHCARPHCATRRAGSAGFTRYG